MPLILKAVASAVLAGVIFFGGIFVAKQNAPAQTPLAGSFLPVGGQTYTLSGAGVTATQSTIPLTSFKTPDGRPITMTMVGAVGYGVIEPNSPTKIEDVTFTGIIQNANGTASLTGVSRGTDFVSPYQASTSLATNHAGGSYFILSNTAGFYGQQFAFVNSSTTITSPWIYLASGGQPSYDTNPTVWASQLSFADKQYVDAAANSGAATSTFGNIGIVWLATRTQISASTASSSSGAPLVIPSSFATSSPTLGSGNYVAVTRSSDEKLSPQFIATSSSDAYNFAGLLSFVTASSTHLGITGDINLGGLGYKFNSSARQATGTVLSEDGSGGLSFSYPQVRNLDIGYSGNTTSSNSTTSLKTISIPAGTLATNRRLEISAEISSTAGASCGLTILLGTGAATTTIGYAASSNIANVQASVVATSTNTGYSIGFGTNYAQSGIPLNPLLTYFEVLYGNPPYTWASQLFISLSGALNTGGGNCILLSDKVVVYSN